MQWSQISSAAWDYLPLIVDLKRLARVVIETTPNNVHRYHLGTDD